jgi:4'-phosphopantetheinyl transferase
VRPAGVEVWLADLTRDGARLAAIALERDLLDGTDRARHAGYRSATDAQDFAASRAALDLVLSRYGAEPVRRMQRGRSGKPFVPGLPRFSLSHTRGYAAMAVAAEGEVGVDIERAGDRSPDHPVIRRIAQLMSLDALRAWTVAEAWVKLHGVTLADLLESAGEARALEDALTGGGPPAMALLALPDELVGCCWHMMAGVEVAVGQLDVAG